MLCFLDKVLQSNTSKCLWKGCSDSQSTFTAGPEAYRMKRWALPRIETLAKVGSSKMLLMLPSWEVTYPDIQRHFWHFWRDFPLIQLCSWLSWIVDLLGWKDGMDGDLLFSLKMSVMAWSTFWCCHQHWVCIIHADNGHNLKHPCRLCCLSDPRKNSQGKYQAMPTRWYSQICDSWLPWSCHSLFLVKLSSSW